MKICLVFAKIGIFLYFALNAFNVLQDPAKKSAQFSHEYTHLEKSIKARCSCKWPEFLQSINLTRHSLQIVKYGSYVQLLASVGVLLHSGFAVLVGLVFFFFQSIHLNLGSVSFSTKLSELESITQLLALIVTCFVFSYADCCAKKNRTRKTNHESGDDLEGQGDRKKNDQANKTTQKSDV